MKRKFAWWGFSFLLGLTLFALDNGKSLLIFLISIFSICVILFFILKKYRVYVFAVFTCTIMGLVCGQMYTLLCYNEVILFDSKNITFEGYITDCKYYGADTSLITVNGKINGGVKTKISYFVENDDFEYYDYVIVTGKVAKLQNSIEFQSMDYNYSKGVFLQGSRENVVVKTNGCANFFMRVVMNFRDFISEKISDCTSEEQSGFLVALLCGDKSQLDNATKTKIYRSGIGHLFAVSGTHLNIITMCFMWILSWVTVSKKVKSISSIIVIWLFAAFAGFSPSVCRSAIMLTAVSIGSFIHRQTDALNSLGLCCFVLCAINPYVVHDPAFVLSFTASFAFGVVIPKLSGQVTGGKLLSKLKKSAISLTAILFITMPFVAGFNLEVSVISPISNLILIPICTLSLILAFLGGITGGTSVLSVVIFKLAGALSGIALKLTDVFAKSSFAIVPTKYYLVTIFCALICWVGIYFAIKKRKTKIYFITALMSILGLYSATTFMSFFDKNNVHIVILPDNKSSTAVVYQNKSACVLDIYAKGKMTSSVQKLMSSRGAQKLEYVFIENGYYYSKNIYIREVYPESMLYLADIDDEDVNKFNVGSYAKLEDVVVTKTNEGYSVFANNKEISIEKFKVIIDKKIYDTSKEEYPIELIIKEDSYEVRRLDYAFVEQ